MFILIRTTFCFVLWNGCTTFLVVVYLLGYLSGVSLRLPQWYISLRESQLPLRLAWALTIHRSQNYTSKSMDIDIGKSERTAGVSYVAGKFIASFAGNTQILIKTLQHMCVRHRELQPGLKFLPCNYARDFIGIYR